MSFDNPPTPASLKRLARSWPRPPTPFLSLKAFALTASVLAAGTIGSMYDGTSTATLISLNIGAATGICCFMASRCFLGRV